ncbi:MAG: penicillin acylase family protein, partial [SAR202 cluster bacterium]|nr:penicillin acylase family protein [SAR202 cluster bacterium]
LPPGSEYKGPLLNAIKDFERAAAAADPLKEVDMGSNNWAVSGDRTATGKPLLAGDPHRGLDTPNVYYQNHLACPDFDAVGCSFPGVPGLQHFGHNAYVCWGVTHAGADYQDLFIERFDKANPSYYEFKGQLQRAQVFHEVVKVKGGKPVPIDVTVTHHGPIIAGDPAKGVAIAFRYTQTAGPNRQAEALLSMLKARSTHELDQAMRHWVDPGNNFLMADVHGNIAYLTRGKVPVRNLANAWLPVPGWTGEHEWKGYIPFEEMPRSHNPKEGYIVTANQKIVSDDYPYYIALDHSPDFRARRITIRLTALKKATLDQVAAIHAERTSIPAQAHLKALKKVKPKDALSKQALDILLAWNASMERDAPAPLIYSAYRLRLDKAILLHLLGPMLDDALAESGRGGPVHVGRLRAHFIKLLDSRDTSMLPPQATWPGLMSQALAEALQDLKSQLGPDMKKWTWGKVHHTVPKHPLTAAHPDLAALLNPPQMRMSGDGDVPQNTTWSTGQPYTISSTAVHRYAYDLSDWNNSKWIVPLGASGHPGSPHFADQAPFWSEIDYIPMLYDWKRISKSPASHQSLNPKKS